ncbi:hypothetical protein V1525DRAFT_422819 [Lipomyces kononenkoae]|uniref:Uncharacterized protein n=1 Tax=Lipomyces kononenkoae TaxID=34357 RepID=A0ACC3SR15_LIPKO
MCGNIPSRASEGGLIAVMHPLKETSSSSSSSVQDMNDFKILFNNRDNPHRTYAMFLVSDKSTRRALQIHPFFNLRIGKSGDLLAATDAASSSEPLYSFQLSATQMDNLEFELPLKLHLGVSTTGIVGRVVTVFTTGKKKEREEHVLGMGIIGWN